MPDRDQSAASSSPSQQGRPPWPDQFTEAQYDRHGELPDADRAVRHGEISALVKIVGSGGRAIAVALESFVRRKPLGALAGAFVAGIVVSLFSGRRRSS
jgi:hypothetical protein